MKAITDVLRRYYEAVVAAFNAPIIEEFASEQEREKWEEFDRRQW